MRKDVEKFKDTVMPETQQGIHLSCPCFTTKPQATFLYVGVLVNSLRQWVMCR